MELTHVDEKGNAQMVDVGNKPPVKRVAWAYGKIYLHHETLELVERGLMKKGDVLGVARIAGIQAAKRTAEWIPLAHPLPLETVEIEFHPQQDVPAIEVVATVRVTAKTGVEMEALVAVSAAALTLYDMCKSIDRGMVIEDVRLLRKSGGKSGLYEADGD